MADPRELRVCDDVEEDAEQPETWDDWVDDSADESFECVFCPERFAGEDALHTHLGSVHGFSLQQQIRELKLDTYAVIQMVNFLRRARLDGMSADQVKQTLETQGSDAFAKEEFLKPVNPDDPLLYCLECADSDSEDEDEVDGGNTEEEQKSAAPTAAAATGDQSAAEQIEKLKKENAELKEQMNKYSRLLRDCVLAEDKTAAIPGAVEGTADNDTYYFDSYSQVGIHREMITDKVGQSGYLFVHDPRSHCTSLSLHDRCARTGTATPS
jgi:protein arginine N-methyltransferase 3